MGKNLIGALIWIFLLSGCGNQTPDRKIVIATLKGPSSMGMIRLIDSLGHDQAHQAEVAILNEPLQVRKMMIDGTADFAILPSTMAAIVYNKGMDYRLLAIPVWGTLYLTGKDTTIRRWENLKGKRIFVMARGMTPDVLFRYLLLKNGLNPDKDVLLDYKFPTHIDLAQAVMAGQADLAVISEPMASMAIKKNPALRRIFSLNDEWSRFEGVPIAETAFLGKGNMLREQREKAEKILSSYAISTDWVIQHPDSAAALMVKYGILPDQDAALHAIPRINLKFVRAKAVEKEIRDYFEVFYRMNPDIIGGKIPDEGFIYR
jgi:NitT/TauT family transport system substrate-binding protein